jgi:hypothetical protein
MTETIEKSLLEIDFASLTRRTFTPSPAAWEDQVLYFLLLDRFSDGQENGGYRNNEGRAVDTGITPLHQASSGRVDYDAWLRAGGGWRGGTLKGLKSKLGYLRRPHPDDPYTIGSVRRTLSELVKQLAVEAPHA